MTLRGEEVGQASCISRILIQDFGRCRVNMMIFLVGNFYIYILNVIFEYYLDDPFVQAGRSVRTTRIRSIIFYLIL